MSEMVERVGRAVADVLSGPEPDWAKVGRAAIAAMREPTAAMVEAAQDADLDIYWSYRSDGRPGWADDAWRVMIDAALAE